jgi:hypothetical protein
MTLRQQSIDHMRAHWKLVWLLLGISATLYGNSLYESPQRRLGLVFFLCGLAFTVCGMPAMQRFFAAVQLREENEKVALLVVFLLAFTGGPALTAAKTAWGVAQPGEYRPAATSLAVVYFGLPLAARWAEPKGIDLRRLRSRIRQATVSRTVANAAGICAVVAFLSARFAVAYPAPLISTTLTLMVAVAVVTHKTFARARKLCTQTHIDVQNLLRDMDDLDDAKGRDRAARKPRSWRRRPPTGQGTDDKHADKRLAVRRSWDVVKVDLRTNVDSGYRLFGLPFLTKDAIADLERKVEEGIEGADSDATDPARADLCAILDACTARIDVLA